MKEVDLRYEGAVKKRGTVWKERRREGGRRVIGGVISLMSFIYE